MTLTPAQIHDAAHNAVAVASIAFAVDPSDEERTALTTVLACATGHGLTLAELHDASGLDEAFITRLLEEAAAA